MGSQSSAPLTHILLWQPEPEFDLTVIWVGKEGQGLHENPAPPNYMKTSNATCEYLSEPEAEGLPARAAALHCISLGRAYTQ